MLKEAGVNNWVQELRNFLVLVLSDQDMTTVRALTREARTSPEYTTASVQLRTRFRQVLVQSPVFDEVYMLDASGQILLSTDPSHEGLVEVNQEYFQQGLQGLWVSPPYRTTGEAAIVVARPISDVDGRAVAVLAGRASLSPLQKLMQEKAGLGTRAETYLVGEDYTLLTNARNPKLIPGQAPVRTDGATQAVDKRQSGAFTGPYNNYEGTPVLGAYRWLPDLHLALLAEQEQAEALSDTYRQAAVMVGLSIIFLIVAVVVALLLARSIAGPLTNLAQTARQIAAGDLALTARVERDDEVGTLARAFNSMTEQLRGLISGLEQRVAERTREVERRAGQIAASAEVSRAASRVLDPDELLSQVVELIRRHFDLYYASVFLVDESGQQAVLRAGTGEAGQTMLERGHTLPVGETSMVGSACAYKEARIALDVGGEAVRFANPLLPLTRSEMALPMRVGDRVVGVLDIQSVRAQAFDESDITALQGMADQIAVALENAHLFQQSQASLKEVERANRLLTQQGWQDFAARADFAEFHQPDVLPLSSQAMEQSVQPLRDPSGRSGTVSIPLRVRRQVIGTLVVEQGADRPEWSATDLGLLEEMASQAAQALESARLFEDTQRRAAREQLTRQITDKMRSAADMDSLLQTTLREMTLALGAPGGFVQLAPLDEESRAPVTAQTEEA
jgi:GAF domain-containing protein/HAMP domain-containing protein